MRTALSTASATSRYQLPAQQLPESPAPQSTSWPGVLDAIVPLCADCPPVERLWLFSFRAAGTATRFSDMDLAVEGESLTEEALTLLPIDLL